MSRTTDATGLPGAVGAGVDLADAADGAGAAGRDAPDLPKDTLFRVLSNRRRRRVVRHLRRNDGESTVSDLAERIAAEETGDPRGQVSSYERKRVYISLYQNNLPLMDDAGVVDYDDDRKTVVLCGAARQLEPYLEDAPESTGSPTMVAAPVLAAAVVLLGSLQLGALGSVPVAAWGLLGVVGLVATTSYGVASRD